MVGGFHLAPETHGRYGIRAELLVYFTPPVSLMHLEPGITGRLRQHFETEVEMLTTRNFVMKIDYLLRLVGITHITAIEVDDYYLFWSDVEVKENLKEAFEAAMSAPQTSDNAAEIYLVSNGVTKDFKLEQDVTFRPKHPRNHPPISILIRAVPIEWIPLEGEDLHLWSERLNATMKDRSVVARTEEESRSKMLRYLDDYRQRLNSTFPVTKFSQELMIDLAAVSVKDFETEARLENSHKSATTG